MTRPLFIAIVLCMSAPNLPAQAAQTPSAAADPLPLSQRVSVAQQKLQAAILSNEPAVRAALYHPDAISLPEFQPALYGRSNILAYHSAVAPRVRMTGYRPTTIEIFDLGEYALEFGTFTAAWEGASGAKEERRGKYANLWATDENGSLRLKADVWGYFEPFDGNSFYVAMPQGEPPEWLRSSKDRALAGVLDRLNRENARAVQTRDTEAKLAVFTDDAAIFPFADRPRRGMAEIRPYLTDYTARGEGIQFDDVRVWNIGFLDLGRHVIEFSKFHVDWRFPDNKGTTKGGGLRVWNRQADGSLKRHREIGTHDHVQ